MKEQLSWILALIVSLQSLSACAEESSKSVFARKVVETLISANWSNTAALPFVCPSMQRAIRSFDWGKAATFGPVSRWIKIEETSLRPGIRGSNVFVELEFHKKVQLLRSVFNQKLTIGLEVIEESNQMCLIGYSYNSY